jgi:hypothetical protein
MRIWKTFAVVAAVGLTVVGPKAVEAQETTQTVRFVPNVVAQFNALTDRPDALGFELHGPDPSQCRHMQAVIRVDAADGTPYLLVSRSATEPWYPDPLCDGGDPRANLYIVRMGSRDKHGERLRSNRLRKGTETTQTPPNPGDRDVRSILFDGSTDWPHYDHPGGMQQVGDVVALALEAGGSGQPQTKILFIDVSDPAEPKMLDKSFNPPTDKAGVVAVTPCGSGRHNMTCETGHYLMLVTGGHNEEVLFFESNVGDLKSPDLEWTLFYSWRMDELIGARWPDNHQTLHFIREGNLGGQLFLAGARSNDTHEGLFGDDYIDLYEVGFDGDKVLLTHRSTRHKISHPSGEGLYSDNEVWYGARLASFAAASGFHITPTGELLFYATEHDNDGPKGTNGEGSVKMGEWRHVDVFRPGSPALLPTISAPASVILDEGSTSALNATAGPPIARPWIELFENESFGFGSRFVAVDYPDVDKDDFDDFRKLDRAFLFDLFWRFDDRAASSRWFAPVSCSIRANDQPSGEPDFPGPRTATLPGTGQRTAIGDLHNVASDGGTDNLFRTISSVEFLSCDSYYAAAITPRWDLNFDGTAETVANDVVLSALNLDGPSNLALRLEARHPIDDRVATSIIPVTVGNANPVVRSWVLMTGPGRRLGVDVPFALVNRPVSASATFTDAGRLDHQSAAIEWGDGSTSRTFTTFSDAFGGVEGQLEARHVYATPGVFNVRLSVTDDDGGVGQSTGTITVVTPSQGVARAIAVLDALIARSTNPARAHLMAARSALAAAGQSENPTGELPPPSANLAVTALAHLNAISAPTPAIVQDVAALKAVLEDIVAAIVG